MNRNIILIVALLNLCAAYSTTRAVDSTAQPPLRKILTSNILTPYDLKKMVVTNSGALQTIMDGATISQIDMIAKRMLKDYGAPVIKEMFDARDQWKNHAPELNIYSNNKDKTTQEFNIQEFLQIVENLDREEKNAKEEEKRIAKEKARIEAEAKAAKEKARLWAADERENLSTLEKFFDGLSQQEVQLVEEKIKQEKAEEEKRIAEEKARLAAEAEAKEKARIEAEAKAAAEKARIEAEAKAAAEKARIEAEAKAAAEKARIEAEAKAAAEQSNKNIVSGEMKEKVKLETVQQESLETLKEKLEKAKIELESLNTFKFQQKASQLSQEIADLNSKIAKTERLKTK